MIIHNEKDRLKAMRMLEDAELPAQIQIIHKLEVDRLGDYIGQDIEYPDTPEPTLGDHTSGMEDCCE